MKKLLIQASALAGLVFASCGSTDRGELIGVGDRPTWNQSEPYGMVYIPQGSYNMGPSDQDVPYALVSQSKTVSVHAFYMDDTEITNNEYRQFVNWVRDSLAHKLLAGEHLVDEGEETERINWKTKIEWDTEENAETLSALFLPENERYFKKKELDPRKLMYTFDRIDLKEAARKKERANPGNPSNFSKDRSKYVIREVVNIFPDTLTWVHDYTFAYNDPMTQSYFWHPSYDDYPVVGVTWKQARAFCYWRTKLYSDYFRSQSEAVMQDFRLPTEAEWEYAARGGLSLSPYPWGGPYIRNSSGCFLGNFKPMRGIYTDDGGFYTVKATSYWPNDYGLYCMSGNVSEWTSDAFDENSYSFLHDLNPSYQYEAKDNDVPTLKRKVIRGGSWKDVGYYLQTGSRSYEYQDSAKCYIGFRCVMDYLGRDRADAN